MRIEFENLTYINEPPLNFGEGLRIEHNQQVPDNLYKYYSPSTYNFASVSKNQFFASHPYQFNDLTDSNPLSFNFSNLTFDIYKKLYLSLSDMPEEEIKNLYDSDKKTGFFNYRVHFYNLLTQKIGIICLSENEMHNLMWGYYASDSGFKIKYNTDKLIKTINKHGNQECLLFPINYIEHKLHIDTNLYGAHLPILIDISTKVRHWQHENEWRIVIFKNDMSIPSSYITSRVEDYVGSEDRFVTYDVDSVEEIVLGNQFFNGKIVENSVALSEFEVQIEVKEHVIEFLKFLSQYMVDKVYMAGLFINPDANSFNGTIRIERSIEKAEIKYIEKNKFIMTRMGLDHLKSFPNIY